jgi:hypothetical protein
MTTSSIFDKFTIDSDRKLELLLKERKDKDKRKTPKIDIDKKLEGGRKLLEKL